MSPFFSISFLFLSFLLFGPSSASRLTNGNHISGLLKPLARNAPRKISHRTCRPSRPALVRPCFPALGFQMPSDVPTDMTGWWCDPADEYAFLGFSYEVSPCQSLAQLQKDFADIRKTFNGRYVRLYGACNNNGFYNDIITAAWENTLGIHALIWCGFDNCNNMTTQFNTLSSILHTNPKGKFVTRVVQMGSEPLYDSVITPQALAAAVTSAKQNLSDIGVSVTVSDLAYGYQVRNSSGSQAVLDALDSINAHMLPFFAADATTANNSWPDVMNDIQYFIDHGKGKKIYLSENGWPSTDVGIANIKPQSKNAVTSISGEQNYYQLLDSHCPDFKALAPQSLGWFVHIYTDSQEPGYGIYNTSGVVKFPFSPRTSC